MNTFLNKDEVVCNYRLNLKDKQLFIPRDELKNIELIVSKIKEFTCLSYFEISEFEFKIIDR